MKTKTDFLYELTKKMSKKDTNVFTKQLKSGNHLKAIILLNEIVLLQSSKSKNHDFDKLLKSNLPPDILKYYRINKSLLKKELISFMGVNRANLKIENEIRVKINKGIGLLELGFIKEGVEIVKKAKKLAIKEECFEEILFAIDTLRDYSMHQIFSPDVINEFNNEILEYQKLLNNYNEFKSLSIYIYYLVKVL